MTEVRVEDRQEAVAIDAKSVAPLVEEFLRHEGVEADEVSIYFVSNEEISQLHADYFDDPTPTDCISFPLDEEEAEYRMLGDIFVSPQVAQEYVAAEGGELYAEISLYVVHGLLHLLGYDDIEEKDREEMRAAERGHMENLAKRSKILYG
jgi:probable rRNA maturation factor